MSLSITLLESNWAPPKTKFGSVVMGDLIRLDELARLFGGKGRTERERERETKKENRRGAEWGDTLGSGV